MKRITKLSVQALMLALIFLISFTACNNATLEGSKDNAQGKSPADSLSGNITISGSTAAQSLLQDLADEFRTVEPGVTIEILGGSSAQGIKDLADEASSLGVSSRELTGEEKNLDLLEHLIAYEGIVIVTNTLNTVTNLTKEQLFGIFKGEVKNWSKVGGLEKEILVVVREENSGIRDDFEEMMNLKETKDNSELSLVTKEALMADGAGAVKANIAVKDNTIGYLPLSCVDDSLKKLTIEGIECTPATIKDKSYPFAHPLLLITKGDLKPEVKAFLEYIQGENGQKIIGEKYITVQ